jgi:hypothetical protein
MVHDNHNLPAHPVLMTEKATGRGNAGFSASTNNGLISGMPSTRKRLKGM